MVLFVLAVNKGLCTTFRTIFENVVLPFSNPIPKNTQLYKIMTTRLSEVVEL